jgi:hypothetical protein
MLRVLALTHASMKVAKQRWAHTSDMLESHARKRAGINPAPLTIYYELGHERQCSQTVSRRPLRNRTYARTCTGFGS